MKQLISILCFALSLQACAQNKKTEVMTKATSQEEKVVKTDEEWKAILTEEQYRVTRKKGTERAYSGSCWSMKDPGNYYCVCCDKLLFTSGEKFQSGTGWPSFTTPASDGCISEVPDHSLGMTRTEVICSRCDAHLGHVFDDGPPPSGKRYCINSISLRYEKAK